MTLIAELKRRKVFKVGAAYLVVAWIAIQAASIGFPTFDAPLWVLRVFILVVMLGFPIAVVMAWVFDVTPEGVKLDAETNGSKRVIGAAGLLIVLALGWYFYGQPAFRKSDAPRKPAPAQAATAADPHSIAVLPFLDMSQAKDQEYFSDGLSEQPWQVSRSGVPNIARAALKLNGQRGSTVFRICADSPASHWAGMFSRSPGRKSGFCSGERSHRETPRTNYSRNALNGVLCHCVSRIVSSTQSGHNETTYKTIVCRRYSLLFRHQMGCESLATSRTAMCGLSNRFKQSNAVQRHS